MRQTIILFTNCLHAFLVRPILSVKYRRSFYQNTLMFRNFGVGSDGEFVSYSYIYFSSFDCEVKLVFHVISLFSS